MTGQTSTLLRGVLSKAVEIQVNGMFALLWIVFFAEQSNKQIDQKQSFTVSIGTYMYVHDSLSMFSAFSLLLQVF